jgi:hypothetical protein
MTRMDTPLPPLPFADWRTTKETLHLYTQIAGKIRMAFAPRRNHWWHATLKVSPRGLTTGLVPHPHNPFEIEFDLVGHGVSLRTADGASHRIALHDGLSVAAFLHKLLELLHAEGIEPQFRMQPYDVPFAKEPFAEDQRHNAYDADAAARFGTVLRWTAEVYEQFAGGYEGKTSPVQFFWHGFDLAVTRFSGRRAPEIEGADPVEREAYSHEVASFGFWPGDDTVQAPAFYGYAAPVPEHLRQEPLEPEQAKWNPEGGMALLRYDDVRNSADPRAALLAFCNSVAHAAERAADWRAAEPR